MTYTERRYGSARLACIIRIPSEWLNDYVDNHRNHPGDLVSIIDSLMSKMAEDDIQDLFQSEMDDDGYFRPEGADEDDSDE